MSTEAVEDTEDDDPSNMRVRAGYLTGLARRLHGQDREMVERASRSLMFAAQELERGLASRLKRGQD